MKMILRESLLIFCVIYLLNIGIIDADDSQCIVNGKKASHVVDERFLSVTIDPAILLSGISISQTTLNLARHLQPSYLRIAGPSTQYLEFNEDGTRTTDYLTEDSKSITFSPAMWWSLNEWILKSNFTPIYALNDQERIKNNWNPKAILSLMEMTATMNINCYWQLGYDCSLKTPEQYRDDLIIIRHLLDAFPEKKDYWKIVASDLSRCVESDEHPDIIGNFVDNLENVDAVMWEPITSSEETYPERDLMQKVLSAYSRPQVPIWSTAPKTKHPVSFESGLYWAKQIGEAAKIGYDVVFRQPRTHELFSDTPAYWVTILHKHLMGRTVLDVKTTALLPTETSIYAHCSKNQNSFTIRGAMTIMMVNTGPNYHKTSLRVAGTQMKNVEVKSYILTSPNENSTETFLNDEKLSLDILSQDKINFVPKLRRAKATTHLLLSLPPKSIGFFVLPGARIPVCVDAEDETNLILEEIKQDQMIDFDDNKITDLFSRFNPNSRFSSLAELYRKLEDEMDEDEKVYKKVKSNTFFRKNNFKSDENVGRAKDIQISNIFTNNNNKLLDLVKDKDATLSDYLEDNKKKLSLLAKDSTKDFFDTNKNAPSLLDMAKDMKLEANRNKQNFLDMAKDATTDLLEPNKPKPSFLYKVKDSKDIFGAPKNVPTLLSMAKDMKLEGNKPNLLERAKDATADLFDTNTFVKYNDKPTLLERGTTDLFESNKYKPNLMDVTKFTDPFAKNNPSLLDMAKDATTDLFESNKYKPNLMDVTKYKDPFSKTNPSLLDMAKDARADLFESSRYKPSLLDRAKDATDDFLEGKKYKSNKLDVTKYTNLNKPSLLDRAKDATTDLFDGNKYRPNLLDVTKYSDSFETNKNVPSFLGKVNDKFSMFDITKSPKIELENKNKKPSLFEMVKDMDKSKLDLDKKTNIFQDYEMTKDLKNTKPTLLDMVNANKFKKTEDVTTEGKKSAIADDVRQFIKDTKEAGDIKKLNFKNLLKKDEVKEKIKLDLNSDEVLKVLTDRAKTKVEKKGINTDIEDFIQNSFKNKMRNKRRIQIKSKRDINMDLLNSKTGDKKVFTMKSRFSSVDKKATIRRPGETSEELEEIEYEAEKPKIPTKIFAGLAEIDDDLPDMSQILPPKNSDYFGIKKSAQKDLFGINSKTPTKDFFAPKSDIFGSGTKDFFEQQKSNLKENIFDQHNIFGQKRENIFDLYKQPKKNIFSLEPEVPSNTFAIPELDLPSFPKFLKTTTAAPYKKTKTFIRYVKEDDKDDELDDLKNIDDNMYHGFHEKFGDNIKIVQPRYNNKYDLEFGEFDDFGQHDNKGILEKEFVIETDQDDPEVSSYVKDLEEYFNNLGSDRNTKVAEPWGQFDEIVDDNDGFEDLRFKRQLVPSKEYTEEDVRFYTKLMLDNIMHMRKSISERKRRSHKEKLLNMHRNMHSNEIPQSFLPLTRSNVLKSNSDEKKYENQIRFLKSRLAQHKRLQKAQENSDISKNLNILGEIQNRFKDRFEHPNGIYGRYARSSNHYEKYNQEFIPKVQISNDLSKRYESKLQQLKEWQPEDLLKLPKLKKSYLIEISDGGIDLQQDIPVHISGLNKNRLSRNIDEDVISAENTIDGFLNEIIQDTSFLKPLFDHESGEYTIVFPSKDSLSLIQTQGDTEIKIHQEKKDSTCPITTEETTEANNFETSTDVTEIITVNDVESVRLESDDDVEDVTTNKIIDDEEDVTVNRVMDNEEDVTVKTIINDVEDVTINKIIKTRTYLHVQKIPKKSDQSVSGRRFFEKVFTTINEFIDNLHTKVNYFFAA